MRRIVYWSLWLGVALIYGCKEEGPKPPGVVEKAVYLGADLSYVNEMEDCGGVYKENGVPIDVYEYFSEQGANIVRVRLWHTPDWTDYSNLEDVKKSIFRARTLGMSVLLDFHYSDDWADPGSQEIPAAWSAATTKEELGDLLYDYTFETLTELDDLGLLPEIVQVGNEINSGLLHAANHNGIDWERTIYFLQKGLQAIRQVEIKSGKEIETMIHIAQPENAFWWFPDAFANGLGTFDWIGLSYYPIWSDYTITELPAKLKDLKTQFNRDIMIVETGYPYSLNDIDEANNILGEDALIEGYPATPQGQLNYMKDLTQATLDGGGRGVIYWEPAWISTTCTTRWGTGSHWDNAAFFENTNDNEVLPVFGFFNR